MKRTTYPLATLVALSIAACATTELTEAGSQVRVGKSDPADGCSEIGTVYGSGTGVGRDAEETMTSAQNDLRNRAAAQGANYVVMDVLGSNHQGMSISGRAFRCDRLPSNMAPTGTSATATGAPAGDPEARLRKLKELLDKGLITQEDYDRRRAEILQSL